MAELPRILFGNEQGHLRITKFALINLAEARPEKNVEHEKKISIQILRHSPGVCCQRRPLISEQFLYHRKFATK